MFWMICVILFRFDSLGTLVCHHLFLFCLYLFIFFGMVWLFVFILFGLNFVVWPHDFFSSFWIDWQSGVYLFCVFIGWFSLVCIELLWMFSSVWFGHFLSSFLLLLFFFFLGGGGGIVLLYCSLANVCFVLIAWGESQKHSLGQKCCYLHFILFIFYFL